MKILLLGRDGQLGWELARLLPTLGELTALDRRQCDLADASQIASRIRSLRPDAIVNAAAYTAVDRAETESDAAYAVNAAAPSILAAEARKIGAYLVHYSTDYVFDGAKGRPYVESDSTHPLQAYGKSKLEGELGIRAADCEHLILRTSWVYAARGRNFLLSILNKAKTEARLRVVADQIGAPTWAFDIAVLTAALLRLGERPGGTFHAAAAGETTWCDFARGILRLARSPVPVDAIATAEYPAATPRPPYSVLCSTLLTQATGVAAIGDWKERLSVLDDLEVLRHLGGLGEHDRR